VPTSFFANLACAKAHCESPSGPAHRTDRRSAGRLRGLPRWPIGCNRRRMPTSFSLELPPRQTSRRPSLGELRRPPINLTGKTAIADLPALLSQCHLFIGNDSGAMHVAAAVGLPIVAVFGPTDPNGTAPVTTRCSIVQQKPYCSPCFLRCCPTDHRCMTAITAGMVAAAARPWLEVQGA